MAGIRMRQPSAVTILAAAISLTFPPIASARMDALEHQLPQGVRPITGAAIKCTNGKAAVYDCRQVDLLSYLPPEAMGGRDTSADPINDIWGWTDPASGREFALVGKAEGTAFVEVTDPVSPRYLGKLPIPAGTQATLWHDIKVYKNYAFVVADGAGDHGMQIFDLTQLLHVKAQDEPATFTETAHYDRIANVHNVVIDTASGFAYTVGGGLIDAITGAGQSAESCGGGLHMIDIRDPRKPTFAGCYEGNGYVHDAQCVVYHGPDQRYRNREICLNSARSMLGIVDVTDKKQPKLIGVGRYPNVSYAHQGWLTDDQRYFFMDDEGDEDGEQMTRTIVFDLNDLEDPVVAKEFLGTTHATDHNLYVHGQQVYEANYRAGLRVLDIRDPKNPVEVGYFDTTPDEENTPGFAGAWSNYPFFKNGVIGISSMNEGLFLVRFTPHGGER